MKKHFLTGLVLFLPAFLTLLILNFLMNLLTKPFIGITEYLLSWLGLQSPEVIAVLSQIFILLFLVGIILFVGLLGQQILMHRLLKFGDRMMQKIPLANKVYKGLQEILQNLLLKEKPNFSQWVSGKRKDLFMYWTGILR